MSFQETLIKIEESETYKEFINNYPEAELCAGFFILDFESNDNKISLDYKINNKIYTFNIINNEVSIQEDELMDIPNTPKLELIEPKTNIELEELKSIVGTQALDNGISSKINKIIAILQIYTNPKTNDKTQVWNLTCMLDQLIILHILINSETGNIIKFERKSLMDLVKENKQI